MEKYDFNVFTGNFDLINADIVIVSADPTTGTPGVLYMVTGDPTKLWYFLNGNRYYITGTLDNPSGTFGQMIATGPMFGLTYAS